MQVLPAEALLRTAARAAAGAAPHAAAQAVAHAGAPSQTLGPELVMLHFEWKFSEIRLTIVLRTDARRETIQTVWMRGISAHTNPARGL